MLRVAAAAPRGLPATVEFREVWIWRWGLVAEFPTFLTPLHPPGNGGSVSFAWEDRAGLGVGAHFDPGVTLASLIAFETRPSAGDATQVQPLTRNAALVRHRNAHTVTVSRVQVDGDRVSRVQFSYDGSLGDYFAPIAEHTVRSLYFEPVRPIGKP